MLNYDTPSLVFAISLVFVIAAVAAVMSVAAITDFVTSNRKVRQASHQSLRSYYGNLVLHH